MKSPTNQPVRPRMVQARTALGLLAALCASRAIGPLWAGFAYDIHNTLSFWTGAAVQLLALFYGLRMLHRGEETGPVPPVATAGK